MRIVLVGNPNSGKTTLFNALTGQHQRVGNWPGVTVEKKVGQCLKHELIDLPGIYSLSHATASSRDMQITARVIAEHQFDMLINVIDACHLERHLYLTSQLLELNKPMILVLSMMDIAAARGIQIDTDTLSKHLGCPVVTVPAHQANTPSMLLKPYIEHPPSVTAFSGVSTDPMVQTMRDAWLQRGGDATIATYAAFRLLEGDDYFSTEYAFDSELDAEMELKLADARYTWVHTLVQQVQRKQTDVREYFTEKLDRIVLHRLFALPIFLSIMYVMFLFAINFGGAFQDFFNLTSDAIFVKGTTWVLEQLHAPAWLTMVCAKGIGQGISTTLTFIPVIAAMFFGLSLLEMSGYMARAAFVVDRLMRWLGLPGKAFVPMIVGFGCNVPAILAARTLDSERDRLLTILMTPFMSCSARLAIYTVFVAAFFPVGGQNVVFSLYLIGISMAIFTGLLLKKTLLRGQTSSLVLELPAYHRPQLKRLCQETGRRLKQFIRRAVRVIVPVCVGLTVLSQVTIIHHHQTISLLAWFGQSITPLFTPMGIRVDNWPATVSLLTGLVSKEVVIGSLNGLYAQLGQLNQTLTDVNFGLMIQQAIHSIPEHFSQLAQAIIHPISTVMPTHSLSPSIESVMRSYFTTKASVYAYLLFILLYVPCVSTIAVIRQEANRRLMWLSIGWSMLVAYGVAVLCYQCSTWL